MHTFNLIHKDIKPENILVTEDGRIVLADFGISTHVKETAGQTSSTFREGTLKYMSPTMKNVQRYGSGEVDLYHNDMWGLKVTMHTLKETSNNKE